MEKSYTLKPHSCKLTPPDELVYRYTQELLNLGYLTTEPIRKYPLKPYAYHVVLKIYAVISHVTYDLARYNVKLIKYPDYYLTDTGLDYVRSFINSHDALYLKTILKGYFTRNDEVVDFDSNPRFNNFRGTYGIKKRKLTNRAMLVRKYGKNNKIRKEYVFNNMDEARAALWEYLKYYPIEQFELYRIAKTAKGNDTLAPVRLITKGHDPEAANRARTFKRTKV